MNELIYFSSSDVMIKAQYREQRQSVRYFSHRGLTSEEREAVESYIVAQIEDVYAERSREIRNLHYLGVDEELQLHLHRVHKKNQQEPQLQKEESIDQAVQDLISRSLSNYYFEQIGYALIEVRRVNASAEYAIFAQERTETLRELVDAYNLYADKKVTLEQVLSKNRNDDANLN